MSEPASAPPSLPRSVSVLGLVLFGCAFLPLTPGGRTFFQVAMEAFDGGVMAGVIMVVGMGSPFLFGLCVALGNLSSDDQWGASLVRMPVTMMHSQLLLVAWVIWRNVDTAIASLPLLLFAAVSSIYVMVHSAESRAKGKPAPFSWYVRWGGTVVAAVAGWLMLQRGTDMNMGIAVQVAGSCGLGLVLRSTLAKTRVQ
ncbi:MAG: hypothetical protein AAF799_21055 [Myxococcota bacterium]